MNQTGTALILIDTPLKHDNRVNTQIEAYKKRGFEIKVINVKKTKTSAAFRFFDLPANLIFFVAFIVRWLFAAFYCLPRYVHFWKNREMARYKLAWFNLPPAYLYDTYVHLLRGRGYAVHHREELSDISVIHANDLAALSFAQALCRMTPSAQLVYDAHELHPFRNRRNLSWLNGLFVASFERLSTKRATLIIGPSLPCVAFTRLFCRGGAKIYKIVCNNFYERPATHFPLHDGDERAIFYIGTMIQGRGMERLKAILERNPDIHGHIFSPEDDDKQRRRAEIFSGVSNATIYFGSYNGVIEPILQRYNKRYGWLWLDDICLSYHYAMPNKLFQYIAFGFHIIYPKSFYMRKFLEPHDLGIGLDGQENVRGLLEAFSVDTADHNMRLDLFWERYADATYSNAISRLF
ncbi:MAG: hypothetical protein ABJK39_05885 [Hyphomicrobiales bacterium]